MPALPSTAQGGFFNDAQHLATVLVVRDYDEAIAFYAEKLGFALLEDTKLSAEKRWVRGAAEGSGC